MHIVFQKEDINTLSKSFELDESLRGEIIEIRDDYAVGPIKDIYSQQGIDERKEWWSTVLSGNENAVDVDSGYVNDPKTVADIKGKLSSNEDEIVWIWIASNKHDVSGYYWLISQLKEFVGKVFVLSLNNLPFINEKGNIFYPLNLFEIPPREFVKAKKLARAVTASEFEIDPDEWTKLANENKMVRVLEGAKKLSQHDEDYYDKYILEFITVNWQKANKVINQFLNKSKHTTGDAYMFWRLKELIAQGKIDASADIKNRKDLEVKDKQIK
ncbi:MAG: DUF3658 domain-containing protein [Ginsengibacter sp.]